MSVVSIRTLQDAFSMTYCSTKAIYTTRLSHGTQRHSTSTIQKLAYIQIPTIC